MVVYGIEFNSVSREQFGRRFCALEAGVYWGKKHAGIMARVVVRKFVGRFVRRCLLPKGP